MNDKMINTHEKTDIPVAVLVIAGPTAVGKTQFALHAASDFDGEIISCDSMQIYRGMDIGTAKPSSREMAICPHHMIDVADPSEPFSAARYSQMARKAVADIGERGKLPVICGGTGLYLDGILYEMDYGTNPENTRIREFYTEMAEKDGPLALHEELKKKDPRAAEEIHPNNLKRTIRALERLETGEENLRSFNSKRTENPCIEPLLIGLSRDRTQLYDRINHRVDKMMDDGLVDEVIRLRDHGLSLENTSMLGIGYKEVLEYLEGNCSLEDAVERIKTSSRHYAKRQFTWFRRYDKMKWLDISACGSEEKAMLQMDEMIDQWLRNI